MGMEIPRTVCVGIRGGIAYDGLGLGWELLYELDRYAYRDAVTRFSYFKIFNSHQDLHILILHGYRLFT